MIDRLKNKCRRLARHYPHLSDEVNETWHSCLKEIEEGGNELEEVEAAMSYLDTIANDR